MPRKLVVLDANALHSNWYALGPNFKVLGEAGKRGLVRVVIPHVALEEVVNNFRRLADDLIRASSSFEALYRGSMKPVLDQAHVSHLVETQQRELREELERLNIEIVSYDKVPHDCIVRRALARRRPFDDKGAGYRDTLIWETTLREVEGFDIGYFVSANHTDFGAERVTGDHQTYPLHPDLLADLESAGHPKDLVQAFRSVSELVHKVLLPAMSREDEAVDEFRKAGNLGAFSLSGMFADPSEELLRSLNAADKRYLLGGDPSALEDPHILGVWEPERVVISDVAVLREGDEDVLVARFMAEVRLELEVSVNKGDYHLVASRIPLEVSDWDWNESYSTASLSVLANVTGTVEVGLVSEELQGLEIESLGETWGWCRHCKAQVMSDAAEECGACGKTF